MNADAKSLLYNVIGGILVSILTAIFFVIRHRLHSYHLQRLLGFAFKSDTEVRMTYGQLLLPALSDTQGQIITHPYVKAPRYNNMQPSNNVFSIEHPISECEVRASTYVATLLGLPSKLRPLLVSDIEVSSLLDSNFISFGGPDSNYKTADALKSSANIFIKMNNDKFSLPSGKL